MDQDVIEIRAELRDFRKATTSSLNAGREEMLDLRQRVETGFAQVDHNFAEVRNRLDLLTAGHEQIVGMLTTLIDRSAMTMTPEIA